MGATIGFPIETVIVFLVISIGAIAIDMHAHKSNEPIPLKNAAIWSVFWVFISILFAGFLYFHHGQEVAILFVTGYALEKVLSVDNLFVMMAIFSWFSIPQGSRHRVLYWGIMGAIAFRLIFVAIGTGLLMLGPWVEIGFAAIVGWTAYMMLKAGGEEDEVEDYTNHLAYRAMIKVFMVWPKLHGHKFLLKERDVQLALAEPDNKDMIVAKKSRTGFYATPLLLCLAVIELSDVMFAFDSVPAIIAVSREPMIVFSAMMFAILGLRTMYFVLEALKQYLVHLEKSVIVLLFFIALKLGLNASDSLFNHGFSIDAMTSLVIIVITITIGVLASLVFPEKETEEKAEVSK